MNLQKISRISGWLLLLLIILYLLTGYSLAGKYGLHRLLDPSIARVIHGNLDFLLIILLILHVLPWVKRKWKS